MKLVSQELTEVYGYGARKGQTMTKKFSCPCGNGFIITESDDFVGFKQCNAWIDCPVCKQKYQIENPTSRNWSIIPKDLETQSDWMK